MLTTISHFTSAITIHNVKVEKLYIQSLNGAHKSAAHAFRIDKPIDESCKQRIYINPSDKELFSTLLAYKISGARFNLIYETKVQGSLLAGISYLLVRFFQSGNHLNNKCTQFNLA